VKEERPLRGWAYFTYPARLYRSITPYKRTTSTTSTLLRLIKKTCFFQRIYRGKLHCSALYRNRIVVVTAMPGDEITLLRQTVQTAGEAEMRSGERSIRMIVCLQGTERCPRSLPCSFPPFAARSWPLRLLLLGKLRPVNITNFFGLCKLCTTNIDELDKVSRVREIVFKR
jgi:hypothetical protein